MAHPSLPRHPADPLMLVVGLGASAGGIAALKQFFVHADPEVDAAYVVILHLSPDHESRLAEVVQSATTMPVITVTGEVELASRSIYVVSPNVSLAAVDGKLTVSEMIQREQRRSPVDLFFRTLADAHGPHAVCIVLSGTGADGSKGLKHVKEGGGLAIAQDPADAEFDDMPNNAIATGLVDHVLPAAAMAGRIRDHARHLSASGAGGTTDTDARTPGPLREILTVLRVRTGHDFSNYKPATVQRRIARRMSILGVEAVTEYARMVRDIPGEPPALMKELLIGVTNFFRDPDAFLALERQILPRLFEGKRSHNHVRAWVAACATGEEAYSIAMLLTEAAAAIPDPPSIQVFGTDLDHRAIAVAREGFYPEADLADVSEARVARFFQKEGAGYRVRRELRELVLFADHNLIKDPPSHTSTSSRAVTC